MIDRERLEAIVREAGRIALAGWPGDGHALDVWDKSPNNPVSAIDLAVDEYLKSELRALLPAAGWLSEETADAPGRLGGDLVWLVDPIDGTRDFIRGRDGWAVSVALVNTARPLFGYLFAPARKREEGGEFWHGQAGQGSWCNGRRLAASGTPVSIDTRKSGVMAAALAAGAQVVNDVSALLWDEAALDVVVHAACPVVLMHSPDPKAGGHGRPAYRDVATEVFDWLEARVAAVEAAGVPRARILIDPGIGFGKSLADNLALVNALPLFHGLGCAIMLGASRKRMIGALDNEAPVEKRLGGSIALALKGAEAGVQLIRVHDVAETVQALKVWRGLRDRALAGG